jgi:hypothetical protein
MRFAFFAAAALVALLPAAAQQPGVAVAGAQGPAADPRVNQVIVYGSDPCPASTDDEITVCARLPEDDRFRIPPNLREDPNAPANQAWRNRAIELSYVGRTGTDSCSTVGGGGFTGCMSQIINQARAERRASGDVNWTRMVEEARQAREARLRAEVREEDEAERNTTASPN